MKIHPHLQEKYNIFYRTHSSEIEFDSIIKYTKRLAVFLETKIETEKLNSKLKNILELHKTVIKNNIKQALAICDTSGITCTQQRNALEILNKYWIYGSYLKDIKLAS